MKSTLQELEKIYLKKELQTIQVQNQNINSNENKFDGNQIYNIAKQFQYETCKQKFHLSTNENPFSVDSEYLNDEDNNQTLMQNQETQQLLYENNEIKEQNSINELEISQRYDSPLKSKRSLLNIFKSLFYLSFWSILILYIYNICTILALLFQIRKLKQEEDKFQSKYSEKKPQNISNLLKFLLLFFVLGLFLNFYQTVLTNRFLQYKSYKLKQNAISQIRKIISQHKIISIVNFLYTILYEITQFLLKKNQITSQNLSALQIVEIALPFIFILLSWIIFAIKKQKDELEHQLISQNNDDKTI